MTLSTGPAAGRAEDSSSYAAAMAEDDVEIQLVQTSHGHSEASRAPCRGLRRSALSLGAVAAGACAVVLLYQLRWSRPLPAPRAADAGAVSGLWSPLEESGPCPLNEVCEGHGCGMPRTPLFYTVGQAFHCLDTNGDLELTKEEIETGGRGGASTGRFIAKEHLKEQISGNGDLSFYWFQDGMRQYRDRMFQYEPAVSEKIVHWVEQILKMLPEEGEEKERELPPYPGPPDPSIGTVDSVFTFGAPAISKVSLWNAAREDGCFPGVRIYNSGTELIKEYKLRMHITDPVPWILTELDFQHYRTNALSLHEDSPKNQGFMKCGGREEPAWLGPRSDMFFWFEGHRPTSYEDNLKALSELIHPSTDAALDWERKTGAEGRTLLESPSTSSAPGMYAGDHVMLKDNATLVRHAFVMVDLPFTEEIEERIGKQLRVLRVRRPGVLTVRPLGYGEGSEWECAQAALVLVRTVKVVKAGSHEEHGPILEAHEGATGMKKKRMQQLAKVREAAHLAMLSYSSVSEVNADLKGRDWNFIGRGVGGRVSVTFLQNEKSLDCVLSFGIREVQEENTNAEFDPVNPWGHGGDEEGRMKRSLVHIYQMLASRQPMLDQHRAEKEGGKRLFREPFYNHLVEDEMLENKTHAMVKEVTNVWRAYDFCGFKEVQHHIHHKMAGLIYSPNFEDVITSHLTSCASVTATGHSLGGALAALWAACANRGLKPGEEGYEDYERVTWRKGAPKRVPSVVSHKPTSIVMKDTSTNMGIGIAGSLSAAAAGDGTLRLSPFVDEGWEQRWQLTPEGFLKNPHSGKCLGVASYDKGEALGTEVQLQTCRQGGPGRDQRWTMLRAHVLAHKYTGRCLDGHMQLTRCPLTDQRWHLTAEGFIVNRISGKCMDVVGSPGTEDGAKLVQWPCEYNSKTTDQLWEFTATGQVRNKLSGKCVEVDNVQSKQHGALWQSNLVLWDCARENTTYSHAQNWAWSDNGFIINTANGKCVDVYGGVDGMGEKPDGTDLVVGSCQRTFPQSDAMWQLTSDHYLMNIGRTDAFRNKCVTITKDEENAPLELQSCETGMRHDWELDETGHIQATLGLDVCIGSDGDDLNLTACNQTDTAQMWALTEEGFLVNHHSQKCIDIKPYDMTLRQDDCHMTDQRWIVRPSGAIRSRLSGLCMDVQGSPPEDMQAGTPLSIWECEHDRAAFNAGVASTDQIWEITYDKTIRNKLTGMCVDIQGDEKTKMYNGASVVMQPCDNSTAQYWDLDLDGFFRNRLSGKCIDIKGPAGHHRGQLLVTYTCENNPEFSNQIWSFAEVATGRETSPKLPFAVAPRRYASGWSDSSGKGYIEA